MSFIWWDISRGWEFLFLLCRGVSKLCVSGFSSSLTEGVYQPRGKTASPAVGVVHIGIRDCPS